MRRRDAFRLFGKAGPVLRSRQTQRSVSRAEKDYYDCVMDFGHNSGEAHAAQIVWHRLRNRMQAQTL